MTRAIRLNKFGLKKSHFWGLLIFLFIAIFNQFLANDKFLLCWSDNKISFFSQADACTFGIRAPIPYSSKSIDKKNRKVGPLDNQDISSLYYRHWLGTDSIGRDILAGLISGSYLALLIGLVSSVIALLIGIFFAYLSGFIGDNGFKLTRRSLIIFIASFIFSLFFLIYSNWPSKVIWLIAPWLLLYFLRCLDAQTSLNKLNSSIPFDMLIFRLIEIFRSIPSLFIILILLPIMGKPSYWNVIVIIALIRWPIITRHLRAEIMSVKKENFIISARSMGLSNWNIFYKYILPLTISPIIIVTAFGFSSAVLLESTLSFLGIGVPLDQVTWGGLLKEARLDFSSWWLAIFPGLCIYLLIHLFNSIGDHINEYLLESNTSQIN